MSAQADLDLNDVALMVRVVQTGSFSAAARERGIPASTASRRIARLEAALGTRLLERTTRALHLTDDGRAFFEHAARAADDLARGTDDLRKRRVEPHGRVRILAPTRLAGPVGDALHLYVKRYPGVSVNLELDPRAINLSEDGVDILILAGPVPDTSEFVARAIWTADSRLLFAGPAYLKERGVPRAVADLSKHALIATRSRDGFASWTLVQARRKRSVTFAPRFCVSEISGARRAALANVGIALLPQFLCAEDVAKKRLVRVLDGWEGETGGVHLLHRPSRSLSVAARACVEALLAALPALDPRRVLP